MTSIVLTVLFFAIVAISALVGFVRGLNKSVIRIMTLVLAVVVTFIVAGPITELAAENILIGGKTLGEMILEMLKNTETMVNIIESAPVIEEAVLVAPAFVMAIVVFPVAFLLLSFVSWLIFLCVQKPLRKLIFREKFKGENVTKTSMGKRLAGLGIGIVTGVIVFGMLMTPICGLSYDFPEQSAVNKVLDALAEHGNITQENADIIKSQYTAKDHPIIKIYSFIGASPAGKAYLDSVAVIHDDGKEIYLTDEIHYVVVTAQTAVEGGCLVVLNDLDNKDALYEILEDQEFLSDVLHDMLKSSILRHAIPEIMAISMNNVSDKLNVPEHSGNAIGTSISITLRDAIDDTTSSEDIAETLSVVISDFIYAIHSAMGENGEIDVTKLDFDKLSEAILKLQNSKLKPLGSCMLDIISCANLGQNNMIGNAIAAIKEGYESGNEEIGGAIGSAGAFMGLVGATSGNEGENNKEAATEAIKVLTENLNSFTVQLLPEILTSETLEDMGVSAENTDDTYNVFETLFDELLDLKNSGAENYDNEIDATLSIYNIATSSDSMGKDEVNELINCAEKSEAISNTLKSVSVSNPFGVNITDSQKRDDIVQVIEENYKENGKNEEDRKLYLSIAKMFGLDADVNLD